MRKCIVLIVCCGTVLFALFCLFGHMRSVQTAAIDSENDSITLVIDAGHGGEDGGASTAGGAKESTINLAIALRAEDLSAFLGIATKMIRRDDVAIYNEGCQTFSQKKVSDLKNRVSIINGVPNAIVLSIHQNHFSEEKYSGAQVFYGINPQGKKLAQIMQTDFAQKLDKNNHRQCKKAENVYLMQEISCPALLVECGFLSNLREAEKLQDADYQKMLVMIMLKCIATEGTVATNDEI